MCFFLSHYFIFLKIPTASTATILTLNFTSSGTWYLYLKNKAGNTNTVDKALTYDVTPPSISVSVSNGSTPLAENTATISLSDSTGFSTASQSIIYKWSTTEISSCPSSTSGWTALSIATSGTSGSNTATITNSVGSGNGKIYVCPYPSSSYYPTDVYGNQATPSNTSPVSANLYLSSVPEVTVNLTGDYANSSTGAGTYSVGSSVTVTCKSSEYGGTGGNRFDHLTSHTINAVNSDTGADFSINQSCNNIDVNASLQRVCTITFTMPSHNVIVNCNFEGYEAM